MALEEELKKARLEIVTDGYDMSLGELMSLYRQDELTINPEFQRYYRWDDTQKTRFVESLLLGIPVPPIFVFQLENGTWELVDGLQRLSTIFQLAGMLKRADGTVDEPLVLSGTKQLPSLEGKRWQVNGDAAVEVLSPSQQVELKRARMRVEILKKGSDPHMKFELFQRLNTGGSSLSEQEVRNCVMVMINRDFAARIARLAQFSPFSKTVVQTETAEKKQKDVELVLRFFVFRNVPYEGRLDVHEFLDDGMIRLASDADFAAEEEEEIFKRTFTYLSEALGRDAFKRFDGQRFTGGFLMSAFEVIAIGVSRNLESLDQMEAADRNAHLVSRARSLWTNDVFRRNSGGGVRGTTRLTNLLPLGPALFSA